MMSDYELRRQHYQEVNGLKAEIERLKAQLAEAVAALDLGLPVIRDSLVGVDEMSFHGELMRCLGCGSAWNNGEKRNEPATPETHTSDCVISTFQKTIAAIKENKDDA